MKTKNDDDNIDSEYNPLDEDVFLELCFCCGTPMGVSRVDSTNTARCFSKNHTLGCVCTTCKKNFDKYVLIVEHIGDTHVLTGNYIWIKKSIITFDYSDNLIISANEEDFKKFLML